MNEQGQTSGESERSRGNGGTSDWQEMPRDLLVATLEDAGGKLIEDAAQQLPAVLALGRRVVQDTTSKLEKSSTDELLRVAQKQFKDRPAATIVGLLGAGMLAGRLLRLKGTEIEGTGKRAEEVSEFGLTGALGKATGAAGQVAPSVSDAGKALEKTAAPLVGGGKSEKQPKASREEKQAPSEAEGREPEDKQAASAPAKPTEPTKKQGEQEARAAPPSGKEEQTPKQGKKASEGAEKAAPAEEREAKPEKEKRAAGAPSPAGEQKPAKEKEEAGYLGVGTHPVRLPEKIAQSEGTAAGLIVLSVEPGSPADKAGIQLGDTLLKIEDEPLSDVKGLVAKLSKDRIGKELHATVLRAGATKALSFTVGAR